MPSFRMKVAILVLCLMTGSTHSALAQTGDAPDKLSQLFVWWNEAMRTPGAYTSEAFAQRITSDASFVIDGVEVMRAPGGWASRSDALQKVTEAMEIVLPFRYAFQVGNSVYTYHVIRARAQGRTLCMLASGHAELRGDLISRVTIVRAEIDPATDKDCWKQ
jgi:hypothetical protein